ncbi:MAG: NAD(P)/FAD-dependent oxidoreductase [Planctomycetota bacterium]|nr:NAD(P)/FAD-dependent oxidoreductase [Planctomycetota bacterium]
MPEPVFDLAVVGAGPAGLLAAIAAAESRRAPGTGTARAVAGGVVLLEQLPRPGVKLLATGGGRCNLTSTLPPDEFPARFGRHGRFILPALAAFGPDALRRFLHFLGVPTAAPDGLHVFPVSDSAADVQRALVRRARELGVRLRLAATARALWIEGDALRGLETSRGRVAANAVILATGGKGYPDLGATGSGYALARQAGHTIVEPTPALVPLVTRETWPREIAGLALSPARARIDIPGRPRAGITGDILFTHTGLSGPAVLDLSGDVAVLLSDRAEVPLRLNLAPRTTRAEWLARLDSWPLSEGRKTLRTLLAAHFPRALADLLCRLAGLDPATRPPQVSRPARRALADLLTALPLTVTATEGWDRAMVTRGGVALKEVDPQTLASRRLPGLAFAGEILDLDAPSGGFNLQWAFSSGRLAGSS